MASLSALLLAETLVAMLTAEIYAARARSPHFDSIPDRRIPGILYETLAVLASFFEVLRTLDNNWGDRCPVLSEFNIFATSGVLQLIGRCTLNERLDDSESSSLNNPAGRAALDALMAELTPLPCRLVVLLVDRGQAVAASDKRELEGTLRILQDLCSQVPHPALTSILQFMQQFQLLWGWHTERPEVD